MCVRGTEKNSNLLRRSLDNSCQTFELVKLQSFGSIPPVNSRYGQSGLITPVMAFNQIPVPSTQPVHFAESSGMVWTVAPDSNYTYPCWLHPFVKASSPLHPPPPMKSSLPPLVDVLKKSNSSIVPNTEKTYNLIPKTTEKSKSVVH